MKKILLTTAMVLACMSSFAGTATSGLEFYADGYKAVVLDDGTAAITWIYKTGDVTIPAEITDNAESSTGTYTVSAVGNGSGVCNDEITSLTLSEGITSIGQSACWGKTTITTLVLPSTFTSIGSYAFGDCTGLTSIRISSSAAPTLGDDVFKTSDTTLGWDYIGQNCAVYVPAGTASKYKNTGTWTYWDSFYYILEPGTVTTGDDGYVTYYNWYGYDVPEGVTAYTVTECDSKLHLTETYAAGAEVAKTTGVILKGEANTTYTFDLLPFATAEQPSSNLLKGVHTAATITAEESGDYYYYKLAKGDNGLGFYWGATDGGVFALDANKAYLALEKTSSGTRFLSFDDTATGIDAAETTESGIDASVYCISGVRMGSAGNLPSGIYVVNGKKVIVK